MARYYHVIAGTKHTPIKRQECATMEEARKHALDSQLLGYKSWAVEVIDYEQPKETRDYQSFII